MEGDIVRFRGLHRGFFALRVARVPRPADAARDRERLRARWSERIELGDPAARYVSMMKAAAEQMGELLDALGVATRIEAGTYEPALIEADSLELVQAAAERLGRKRWRAARAPRFGSTALRWKPVSRLSPCAPCDTEDSSGRRSSPPARRWRSRRSRRPPHRIVLSEDREGQLGASTARRVIEAIGGSLTLEGERLLVRLPA